MYNLNKVYDKFVEYDVATSEEIDLVTSVVGWHEQAFEDIVSVRLALDIEQFAEEYGIEIEELEN